MLQKTAHFVVTGAIFLAPLLVGGVARLVLMWPFRRQMQEVLPEEANEREAHRTLFIALAGFSFAALLGVVARE